MCKFVYIVRITCRCDAIREQPTWPVAMGGHESVSTLFDLSCRVPVIATRRGSRILNLKDGGYNHCRL